MKRLIIIGLILVSTFDVSAQKALVDIFIPGTVLIKYKSGGSSSGVIVGDSSYIYLVTARHCLFNEANKKLSLIDTTAFIIYYSNDAFGGNPDTIQINLSSALRDRDLIFDPINDIAIIAIAEIIGETVSGNTIFKYKNSTSKLSKVPPDPMPLGFCLSFDKVDVGDDCTIIGFPSSLQINSRNDYDFQRPLLRKGAIAGKDKKKGSIIIDCPSYQGNSGGPVIATSLYNKSNIGLIGVVSRSILHVEQLESSYYKTTVGVNLSNSGYTVVIPIEFAKKLMEQRRNNE